MSYATLRDELLARGYTYEPIVLDRLYKQYFAPNGQLAITKTGYYEYPFVSTTAKYVCQDKAISYQLASALGVSIPKTIQTTDIAIARQFLVEHKKVIVKPANLEGGKGLTLNIETNEQLEAALRYAVEYDSDAPLIQEQFIGEEIRFTVIKGRVHSAILRQSPRVTGDGEHSIEELVAEENTLRTSLVFPTLSYPQLSPAIIPERLLKQPRIPAKGEVVTLSNATMIRAGASFYGVLDQVHPTYIQLIEHMAAKVNPSFLVVDIMVKQWQAPMSPGDYVFIEFNTAPALEIYTSLRGGTRPDTINALADLLDEYMNLSK